MFRVRSFFSGASEGGAADGGSPTSSAGAVRGGSSQSPSPERAAGFAQSGGGSKSRMSLSSASMAFNRSESFVQRATEGSGGNRRLEKAMAAGSGETTNAEGGGEE